MSSDPVQYGEVKSSYFWDDGSGINGDTGAPASGKPMQKGMAASPSWPLGTEGYVEYNGKKAEFFIGDRGPGHPAENCDVLLDLDGKTFAELTGQSWNDSSYTVTGGQGHIEVEYYITEWGDGAGTPGPPQPMSGSEVCDGRAVQPVPASAEDDGDENEQQDSGSGEASAEEPSAEESGGDGGGGEKKAQDSQSSGGDDSQGSPGSQDSGGEDSQAQQAQGDDSDEQQSGAASGDGGGSGEGLTAESASNEISGITLAGNDLPLAAGVLSLAILPALLAAFLFARRKPAAGFVGRHRAASPLSVRGLRETAASYRQRARRSARDAGGTGRE